MALFARRLASLVATAAVVLAATASSLGAQAQATTGIIRGVVSDAAGAPINGATVTLRNQQTNFTRVLQTSSTGIYVGTLLPLGSYEVTVRAIGHAPVARNNVAVRVGQVAEQTFKLERQAVELAAVVIGATATPVDVAKTEASARLNDAAVQGLPNNGRNFLALTLLTPGVAVAQGPDGDVLSVAGQKGISNNVSVDGADYNNPFFGEQRGGQRPAFTFNLDAVQEMVVTSQGANAEFGRSAGGFVNVVTKSGTNELKGTAHYFGKSSALSGQLKGNGVTLDPDFGQHQFGFTVGGPLKKDKLFYFLAYDQQSYSDTKQQNRPASAEFTKLKSFLSTQWGGALKDDFRPIDRTNDAQVFLAKLDWSINPRNLLSMKYNFTNSKQVNGTFDVDTWGASANAIENAYSNAFSGQLSTQISDNVSNEFRFQFAREDRPRDYDAPRLPNGRDFPDIAMDFGNAFRIGRPFFIPVEYYDTRIQLLNNVTWARGNHLFKAGGEINAVSSNQTFIGFANGRFIFSSVDGFINYSKFGNGYVECSGGTTSTTGACPTGASITGPVLLYLQQAGVGGRTVEESGTQKIPQTDMSLFIQDTWKPTPRLTINYGLRWEGEKQPDVLTDPSKVFFAGFIGKTVTNAKGTFAFPSDGTIPSDYGMFQPRLGLAWDRNGDGTEVVRASAGIYHARVAALNFAAVRNNNGSIGQTMFRNSALTGILGAPPAIENLLPAPGANQAPWQPGVFVVDKNFRNPRTISTSLAYERALGTTGLTGSASYTYAKSDRLTRFVNRNDAVFGNPWSTGLAGGNGIGDLTTVESTAESKYSGLTVGLARRQAKDWVFDANYTISWDRSNDDNERDPFTFRYARADRLDDEWGYSDRDQRHRFNAFVLTSLGYNVTMNNRFTYTSASPMSAKCGTNNKATSDRAASAAERICPNGTILERNTLRRRNEYASWDLRFARPVKVGTGNSAELIFEVFNVLGRNNFKDPAFGSLLFNFDGTIRSGLGDPRQMQLGVRYSF
ncbi:MAG: TonB-dependent receptor [Gemmatimonadetes bacterium]|nr:TonB-dependent receptor [Gemmatimonadota bacterium]